MATWRILEQGKFLALVYRNNQTGCEYPCGQVASCVGAEAIVEWIFNHGDPGYGDLIELPSGTVIHYRAPRTRYVA